MLIAKHLVCPNENILGASTDSFMAIITCDLLLCYRLFRWIREQIPLDNKHHIIRVAMVSDKTHLMYSSGAFKRL